MSRQTNSGKRLSRRTIAKMRMAYAYNKNIEKIARDYGVSPITVAKYRDEDNWDEFAEAIQAKAREKAIDSAAELNRNEILILQAYISLMGEKLEAIVDPKSKADIEFSITGLDRAARCKQLLMGNPDSRQDGGDPLDIAKRALQSLTTDELRRYKSGD